MTRSSGAENERRNNGPAQIGPAEELLAAVRAARRRPELLLEIRQVLESADAGEDGGREDRRQCLGGGACCRFDLMGHRVYLSTGELALLGRTVPPAPERAARLRCPYQVGPHCRARGGRPLGCRIYFCRDRDDEGQARRYEQAHERIRALHAGHGVAYQYVELTWALGVLAKGDSGQGG